MLFRHLKIVFIYTWLDTLQNIKQRNTNSMTSGSSQAIPHNTPSSVFIILKFLLNGIKYDYRIIYITILTLLNNFVLEVLSYRYYFMATQGDLASTKYYTAIDLIIMCIKSFIITEYMKQITCNINHQFTKQEVIKYSKLTFQSRNTRSAELFWDKLSSIDSIFKDGYNVFVLTTITVCTNLGIGISTFWQKQLIGQFFGLSIVWLLIYRYVLRPYETRHKDMRKRLRNINSYLFAKLHINLLPFQYKERKPEYIYDIDKLTNENIMIISKSHKFKDNITEIMSFLLTSAICIFGSENSAEFLVLCVVSNKFVRIVHDINDFITDTRDMITEYDTYMEFWSGAKFIDDLDKLELQPDLYVEWVDILKGSYQVQMPTTEPRFRIGQGSRILVQGPTGGGKTTLVDGIIGKLDGVEFNIGIPGNYYHTVSDMFQNIREMISVDISIRDYFKEEPNDDLIMECLELTFDNSEIENIIAALNKKLTDPTTKWLYDFYAEQAPTRKITALDVRLDDILSGGQKSRLCLASRCYELIRFQKQMLVMDEPEQGSDSETAVLILNRIFDRFPNVAIICVSHMCQCQINALKVNWTSKIHVVDGTVRVQNITS